MMKQTILLSLLIVLSACGKAKRPVDPNEGYSGVAEPLISQVSVKKFDRLPLSGKAKPKRHFWSGDYWALNKGLINYRWYTQQYGFNLHSPSLEEAKAMSQEELKELSPAEKFDLLQGRYHYPLKDEVAGYANPNAEFWEGICHGWSPATLNYNEPTPKVLLNPQGIAVPFGSTDIKALISYYYANEYKAPNTYQTGRRCPQSGGLFNWNPDCSNDLSASTFHIILTNNLGLKGRSFIADIKRFEQVWNHPIYEYHSEIVDRHRPGIFSTSVADQIVRVRTEIHYVNESVKNTWEPILGTDIEKIDSLLYEYDLELDANGDIIGGKWKSKERPDFLWTSGRPDAFTGKLAGLQYLLDG